MALRLAPPTRSDAFSRLAIQRAALLDAPLWLSANTEAPRASGFMNASAWIETKRSAWTRRAFLTRSCSGTKKSASRVSIARMLGLALRRSRRSIAIARTTSFSLQAGRADRAGILAAVAGIDGDDDEAIDLRLCGLRRQRRGGRIALRIGARAGGRAVGGADAENGGAGVPSAIVPPAPAALAIAAPGVDAAAPAAPTRPMNSPSASWTDCAAFFSACSRSRMRSSRGSRSLRRMQVEDEPVPVRRNRLEREQLGRARLLEVDDQADDARLVLADANAGDERIVGAHLADQLAQLRAELEAVDVDDEAVGRGGEEVACRQRRVGLDRHPRVVGRRPDAHGDDRRAPGDVARAEQRARASPVARQRRARREVMAGAPGPLR